MFAGFPNQSPPLTMLKGNREHTQQGMNNPPQGGYTGFQVIGIIECPGGGLPYETDGDARRKF